MAQGARYLGQVHEVGALARMWVNGDYRSGISVLDRTAARALETKKIADAMADWLNDLVVGAPVYSYVPSRFRSRSTATPMATGR